jgi:signal transduction histidine kinase
VIGPKGAVRCLIGALALVMVGFAAETAYMFHADHKLDLAVHRVQQGVLPAVSELTRMRRAMIALGTCAPRPEHRPEQMVACTVEAHRQVVASFAAYLRTRNLPVEPAHLDEIRAQLALLSASVAELRRSPKPFDPAMSQVLATLGPLDEALDRLTAANVRHTLLLSEQSHALLHRSEAVELILATAALLIATFATILGLVAMRRHQRSLEQRAAELERFGETVAHDLLSPLSSLGLAMPVIQERHPDDEQTQRLTSRALNTVRHVRALVDGLLDFARAGVRPAAAADVDSVLNDVATELSEQATQLRARIDVEHAAGRLACSSSVLYSITANLATNALKYLGDSPERRVRLRAHARNGSILVEVEDSGPGIPPSLAELIFDPYVRLTRSQPGLGLGLATVKRLVLAHGGQVGVRSAPSGGSIFWFELPAAPDIGAREANHLG